MATDAIKSAMESQMKNLEAKTGRKLDEWFWIVNESGLQKHGELVSMLKEKYGLGHGNANMLVHHAKQSHAGFAEDDVLISEQYKGKETLKSWYDVIIKNVQAFGSDVEVSPKKAYVSLRRKKQFAILQPSTKSRLDIGLNLKEAAPSGKLEDAGSWNGMCNYRIRIEDEKDLDNTVTAWLQKAYEQAG